MQWRSGGVTNSSEQGNKEMAGRKWQTHLHQEERTPRVRTFCLSDLCTTKVLIFIFFQAHQAAPIGSFYRRSTTSMTQEPDNFSDNSLYCHPGLPLPVGRTSTPGPTRQHPPFYPMSQQLPVSAMESDVHLSVQSALKAIVSQTTMQKKWRPLSAHGNYRLIILNNNIMYIT